MVEGEIARNVSRRTATSPDRKRKTQLNRRGRIVVGAGAVLGAVGLTATGVFLTSRGGQDGGSTSTQDTTSSCPVVVKPGDRLWTIARGAQPEGDVRPLVTAMDRARLGRSGMLLQPGETVNVCPPIK